MMDCPRSITGTAGSRIKVIFGKTGSDYVLLIDEDDGNTKWQSQTWSYRNGINDKIARQIDNCKAKDRYVTDIASGPGGEWYITGEKRDGTGGHGWWGGIDNNLSSYIKSKHGDIKVSFGDNNRWVVIHGNNGHFYSSNINNHLAKRLNLMNSKRKKINFISLLNDDCYYISDDGGSQWVESNTYLCKEFDRNSNDSIVDVIKATDGSWLVIRERSYVSSTGVSNELEKSLSNFYSNHSERVRNRKAAITKYHDHQRQLKEQKEAEELAKRLQEELALRQLQEKKRIQEIEQSRQEEIRQKQIVEARKSEIIAKNIKVGDHVTALGLSQSTGDCQVVSIALGLLQIKKSGSSVMTEISPSNVTLHHNFHNNQREYAVLCLAHDKYEAAVALYHCICDSTSCICTKQFQGNVFLPNANHDYTCVEAQPRINLPDTTSATNYGGQEHCSLNVKVGQRVYVQRFAHANITNNRNKSKFKGLIQVVYDDGKKYHVQSESITTEGISAHPLPPVYEKQCIQIFDEYKCIEKIDVIRLEKIHKDLRTDYEDRKSMCKKYGESSTEYKALQRCAELEMVVNAMVGFLKDLARDESRRYVEYEVQYEHRDPSGRGRLFANGLKVEVHKDKYPRTTTLQGIHRDLRAPLVGEFSHDIDCVNSEVRLLCSLAMQMGLKDMFPTLFEYRDDRKKWLKLISSLHGVSESDAKRLPNILINGGQYETWLKAIGTSISNSVNNNVKKSVKGFIFRLKAETMVLRDKLLRHPRYRWTEVEREKLSQKGKVCGAITMALLPRIIQCSENEVLGIIHRCFFQSQWIVRAKIFDGLIVEKSQSGIESIEEAMRKAEMQCSAQGWDIQLCEKPLHGLQDKLIETITRARQCTNCNGREMKRRRLHH